MSGISSDINFARLNNILDTVTHSLSDISKIRDEQNNSISNLSRTIDMKTGGLNEKCNIIENKLRRQEAEMVEDINKIRSQNKTVYSGLDSRIISLELQIKLMEEAMASLRVKHEENCRQLDELRPKIGKKRKRFWLGF